MDQEPVFGRRAPSRPAAALAPPQGERPLPSLTDLGLTPSGDPAELRAFKQGVLHRRFVGRGGWRWVAGICFSLDGALSFLGFGPVHWAFGAAGVAAVLYSFRRHAAVLDTAQKPS